MSKKCIPTYLRWNYKNSIKIPSKALKFLGFLYDSRRQNLMPFTFLPSAIFCSVFEGKFSKMSLHLRENPLKFLSNFFVPLPSPSFVGSETVVVSVNSSMKCLDRGENLLCRYVPDRHQHHQKKVNCKASVWDPLYQEKSVFWKFEKIQTRKNTSHRNMKKRIPATLFVFRTILFSPSCQVFSKGFGMIVARMARQPPSKLVKLMIVVLWSASADQASGFPKKKLEKPAQHRTSKLKNRIMFDACHAYCSRKNWEKKNRIQPFSKTGTREKLFYRKWGHHQLTLQLPRNFQSQLVDLH